MATTTDTAPAGPWRIEGNAIHCKAGSGTKICFIGGPCTDLIVSSAGLPAVERNRLLELDGARVVMRRGPLLNVQVPRFQLAKVARLLKAETL